MKIKSSAIECLHLDPGYALLSVQNILTCLEYFRLLDMHYNGSINDCQFWMFMKKVSDLSRDESDALFHLLDVDHSGEMDFEEFYLVFCIMVACKDQYEKEFIFRHSNSIFKLIDADASGLVSKDEFEQMGVLFNFDAYSISSIFNEFDISGDKNLDFGEFRLFTMACIDEQRSTDARLKIQAFESYQSRLIAALREILLKYVRTDVLPRPMKVGKIVASIKEPFIDDKPKWRRWWDPTYFKYALTEFFGVIWHYVFIVPFVWLCRRCEKCCEKSKCTRKRKDKKTKTKKIFSFNYYNKSLKDGRLRSISRILKTRGGTEIERKLNT